MRLTEAKLKQMILEAYKKTYNMDFGIPTPDERLRAKLGDEKFDKIQSLDKQQADMMKQAFDPNYPQEVKSKTLRSFMESHGFKALPSTVETQGNIVYHVTYYYRNDASSMETLLFTYNIVNAGKGQKIQYDIYFEEAVSDYEFQHRGYINVPDMFDLDVENKEDAETISALVLKKERARLEKLVEGEFDHPAI